jgi:hypothetical protein
LWRVWVDCLGSCHCWENERARYFSAKVEAESQSEAKAVPAMKEHERAWNEDRE